MAKKRSPQKPSPKKSPRKSKGFQSEPPIQEKAPPENVKIGPLDPPPPSGSKGT
jgi:hypothetical protein